MKRIFLLVVLAISATAAFGLRSAYGQARPGAEYDGTLTGCSTGTLTLGSAFGGRTSSDGGAITYLHVTDVTIPGILSGIPSLDIPVNIPIASDGTFSADFSPFNLTTGPIVASVHVEGRFEDSGVSGSFSVTVNGISCSGTFTAQVSQTPPPTPSPPQATTFAANIASASGCGGGKIAVTRSADMRSVTRIAVSGFEANGETFSGSGIFPEGTVPINPQTGAFDWAYFPGEGSGQEISVSGTFASGALRGDVTVSPSTCGPVGFEAVAGASSLALPGTGLSDRTGTEPIWPYLAVAGVAVAAIGIFLGLRRRA